MRIGIDGRYIQDRFPGIGRYTFNLARALAQLASGDSFLLLHNPRQPSTRHPMGMLSSFPNLELIEVPIAPFSPAEQWRMPLLIRGLHLDLFHSPYYIRPYLLPCPAVVTIHDLIPRRYPQYFPSRRARIAFALSMRLTTATASRIIAVSQATKADLGHFLKVSPAKISVIYEAADPSFHPRPVREVRMVLARWGLEPGYILYLGINKPHKNLIRLTEAYACLDTSRPLVLAGREDPRYPEAKQRVAALGLEGQVRFLGDVLEGSLPALYGGAELFVLPSLWEGFGLPVLEAMASGVPVACSRVPALLEVVGEAALTFDSLDAEAMAQTLEKVLSDADLRQRLRQGSLARARTFSWERAAQETLAVYREVVG